MSLGTIDAIISLLAFISCVFYGINILQCRHFGILGNRLSWLIVMVAIIFLVRGLNELFSIEILVRFLNFLSFLLPVFILVSVEAFIKRHASLWLKFLTFGSLLIGIATLGLDSKSIETMAAITAATSLILTCAFCAIWMYRRSLLDLPTSEQSAARIYSATLLLLIPFIGSDFYYLSSHEIRFGATGFVIGIFVFLRTTIDSASLKQSLLEVFIMVLFSLPVVILGITEEYDVWTVVALFNMTIVIFFTMGIVTRIVATNLNSPHLKKIQDLSKIDLSSQESFFNDLGKIFDLQVLHEHSLSIYNLDELRSAFSMIDIISVRTLKDTQKYHLSLNQVEQIAHLLSDNNATHALMLPSRPNKILLFNMPPLGHEAEMSARLSIIYKLLPLVPAKATP